MISSRLMQIYLQKKSIVLKLSTHNFKRDSWSTFKIKVSILQSSDIHNDIYCSVDNVIHTHFCLFSIEVPINHSTELSTVKIDFLLL